MAEPVILKNSENVKAVVMELHLAGASVQMENGQVLAAVDAFAHLLAGASVDQAAGPSADLVAVTQHSETKLVD